MSLQFSLCSIAQNKNGAFIYKGRQKLFNFDVFGLFSGRVKKNRFLFSSSSSSSSSIKEIVDGKLDFLINMNHDDFQEESIDNFVKANQFEKFEIRAEIYGEMRELCEEWETTELKEKLEEFESQNKNKIDFIISQMIQNENRKNKGNEILKAQNYNREAVLAQNIKECLSKEIFGFLSISTIYRILDKTKNIPMNDLFEFILRNEHSNENLDENRNDNQSKHENIDKRKQFSLLYKFINIQTLTIQNQCKIFQEMNLIPNICNYLKFPIEYIKEMKRETQEEKEEYERKKKAEIEEMRKNVLKEKEEYECKKANEIAEMKEKFLKEKKVFERKKKAEIEEMKKNSLKEKEEYERKKDNEIEKMKKEIQIKDVELQKLTQITEELHQEISKRHHDVKNHKKMIAENGNQDEANFQNDNKGKDTTGINEEPMITLTVINYYTNKKYEISCGKSLLISSLKNIIQKRTNIPNEQQVLFYNNITLESNQALKYYEIGNKMEIILKMKEFGKYKIINLFVKTDKDLQKIEINQKRTLLEFKQMIQNIVKIPVAEQSLIYNNNFLLNDINDFKTIGIPDQSIIEVRQKNRDSKKEKYRLYVQYEQKIYVIDCLRSDLISSVKADICGLTGFCENEQILLFNSEVLDSREYICDCHIPNYQTLQLQIKENNQILQKDGVKPINENSNINSDDGQEFIIKTIDEKTIILNCLKSETLQQIKTRLVGMGSYSHESKLVFIYKGKILDDNTTVEDIQLRPGNFVFLNSKC